MIIINGNLCGNKNGQWKGGRRKDAKGYIKVCIPYNNPFVSMIKSGHDYCIAEHRLIMAKHLGRPLESWETVHHINNIRDDNRIANLILFDSKKHLTFHHQISLLKTRIKELEEENNKLKGSLP